MEHNAADGLFTKPSSLILGMYNGNRRRFLKARRQYGNDDKTLLNDLRYGLCLRRAGFVEKWRKVLREEMHREKPDLVQ